MPNIFTSAETAACCRLIELALREDLGDTGDVTSEAVIPSDLTGCAALVARENGVLAGLASAEMVMKRIDPSIQFEAHIADGERMKPGDRIAVVSGRMRSILAAERTALNFVQHLSGIATLTRRYVDAVAGLPCRILDTRKTTPGWRLLEKYAVRCGGGHNHRTGLYDGILIKDNHLGALRDVTNPIRTAGDRATRLVGNDLPIEIEVDSLEQFDQAASAGDADIILLDNMTLAQLRTAVRRNRNWVVPAELEASGGVTLETVRAIAETGVDRISVGALTHSAPALDIALDFQA